MEGEAAGGDLQMDARAPAQIGMEGGSPDPAAVGASAALVGDDTATAMSADEDDEIAMGPKKRKRATATEAAAKREAEDAKRIHACAGTCGRRFANIGARTCHYNKDAACAAAGRAAAEGNGALVVGIAAQGASSSLQVGKVKAPGKRTATGGTGATAAKPARTKTARKAAPRGAAAAAALRTVTAEELRTQLPLLADSDARGLAYNPDSLAAVFNSAPQGDDDAPWLSDHIEDYTEEELRDSKKKCAALRAICVAVGLRSNGKLGELRDKLSDYRKQTIRIMEEPIPAGGRQIGAPEIRARPAGVGGESSSQLSVDFDRIHSELNSLQLADCTPEVRLQQTLPVHAQFLRLCAALKTLGRRALDAGDDALEERCALALAEVQMEEDEEDDEEGAYADTLHVMEDEDGAGYPAAGDAEDRPASRPVLGASTAGSGRSGAADCAAAQEGGAGGGEHAGGGAAPAGPPGGRGVEVGAAGTPLSPGPPDVFAACESAAAPSLASAGDAAGQGVAAGAGSAPPVVTASAGTGAGVSPGRTAAARGAAGPGDHAAGGGAGPPVVTAASAGLAAVAGGGSGAHAAIGLGANAGSAGSAATAHAATARGDTASSAGSDPAGGGAAAVSAGGAASAHAAAALGAEAGSVGSAAAADAAGMEAAAGTTAGASAARAAARAVTASSAGRDAAGDAAGRGAVTGSGARAAASDVAARGDAAGEGSGLPIGSVGSTSARAAAAADHAAGMGAAAGGGSATRQTLGDVSLVSLRLNRGEKEGMSEVDRRAHVAELDRGKKQTQRQKQQQDGAIQINLVLSADIMAVLRRLGPSIMDPDATKDKNGEIPMVQIVRAVLTLVVEDRSDSPIAAAVASATTPGPVLQPPLSQQSQPSQPQSTPAPQRPSAPNAPAPTPRQLFPTPQAPTSHSPHPPACDCFKCERRRNNAAGDAPTWEPPVVALLHHDQLQVFGDLRAQGWTVDDSMTTSKHGILGYTLRLGDARREWSSAIPGVDLPGLAYAGSLMCGMHYATLNALFSSFGLGPVSKDRFYASQNILMPLTLGMAEETYTAAIQQCTGKDITWTTDAQWTSQRNGYYANISGMDCETGLILAAEHMSRYDAGFKERYPNHAAPPTSMMEPMATARLVRRLKPKMDAVGATLDVCVHDNNKNGTAVLRKKLPDSTDQMDMWHTQKGWLAKPFAKLLQRKDLTHLQR